MLTSSTEIVKEKKIVLFLKVYKEYRKNIGNKISIHIYIPSYSTHFSITMEKSVYIVIINTKIFNVF